MHLSSVIKLFLEAFSFVCFLLMALLPTLFVAQYFFAESKSKKVKSQAIQEQYIETKLQEYLSNLETRVDQRLLEANDRMHHQNETKQSRIEDLHQRLDSFEAMFEKETHAQKLILDSKSLLLELALHSRDTCMDGKKNICLLDHNQVDQTYQMKLLAAAVQGIADTTKTFNDLLPRVLALAVSQSTPQETAPMLTAFEQQIKYLSQKVDQTNETVENCVQRTKSDHFDLKTLVKLNRTALETKMNEMEADIRGQLVTHNHQITDTIKVVADASTFVHRELSNIQVLVRNASAYCANLKDDSDRLATQLECLCARMIQLERRLTQAASEDNGNTEPDHIILY
ncbi:hypothetical protein MAM1_0479c10687 [Mucor ambiguus]|uniref:Uncharacterized protein n=1 Tax=Mucor ambiguus TaxID=91626 RepID=A0A0C9LYK1_9FUNG|nr:hypothetical protein MAM1_0479c10687 [Mucor ambiguus]